MINTMRLLPFACLALLTPCHAQQLSPASNEFLVNQQIAGAQSLPHVASDEAGGYVIAWTENGNTVKARCFGADHQAVTDEFVVAAAASRAKVYYWSEGRYLIAWQGNPSGSRVLQADGTLGEVYPMGGAGENIDMHIKNDVAIVAAVSGAHIVLRKWNLNTGAWEGDYVQASEAPANNYILPQVRWTSTGDIVAVYANGSGTRRVYRKTFNGNLLAQAPEEILFTTPGTVGAINISINAQDDLLLYARFGVNGTDVFWGQVLDADGTELMAGVGNMSAPYAYYYTDCELYDNGKVVLTNNYMTSLNDPEDYNVRVNYGTFPGAANSTGFQVASNTVSGEQRYPSVAQLPNGGFVMAWNGNGFQGDSDGVYARAFHAATFPGVMATTALPLEVDETGTTATLELRLGSQPEGNVVVDLAASDPGEASVGTAQVTFTPGDWDQPQSITITGLDDAEDDGDITLHVVAAMNPATADPLYAGLDPQQFAAVNRDDDATFSWPAIPAFCRSDGLPAATVLVTNNGDPIGDPQAHSSDQAVVDDGDISAAQQNATTFSVGISGLEDNVPGNATITFSVTDGHFTYSGSFVVTTQGETPVIAWEDMELVSTAASSYQWYLDGTAIPGAVLQGLAPAANGSYTVETADANGCTAVSAPYFFGSTGVADGQTGAVRLYPQPADRQLFLAGAAAGTPFRILDGTGRTVLRGVAGPGPHALAVDRLAPGLHVVLLDLPGRPLRLPVVIN
ncbi:MAG: hypothetical protein KJZ58_09760 [Flavobacteriales bacterium]|nr:hypothetical protein [Flavobacteriales bacterium]